MLDGQAQLLYGRKFGWIPLPLNRLDIKAYSIRIFKNKVIVSGGGNILNLSVLSNKLVNYSQFLSEC
jgi:hypothetical protein